MKTYLLLSLEHSKPIPELSDLVAGRIYTMDSIEKNGECAARILTADEVRMLDGNTFIGYEPAELPAILKRQAA